VKKLKEDCRKEQDEKKELLSKYEESVKTKQQTEETLMDKVISFRYFNYVEVCSHFERKKEKNS